MRSASASRAGRFPGHVAKYLVQRRNVFVRLTPAHAVKNARKAREVQYVNNNRGQAGCQ